MEEKKKDASQSTYPQFDSQPCIDIQVSHKRLLCLLTATLGLLLVLNFGMQFIKYALDPGSHVLLKLQVNGPGNAADFLCVLLLLMGSALVAFIAFVNQQLKEKHANHWTGLGIVLFCLALDQAAGLEQKLGRLTWGAVGQKGGVFPLAWVIFFGTFAAVLALAYIRFLVRLPLRTRILFLLSGGSYVLAALIMQVPVNVYVQKIGDNLTLQLLLSLPVGLKMSGVSLFIFSVLDYMRKNLPKLEIEFQ